MSVTVSAPISDRKVQPSTQSDARTPAPKREALTSLRFFAAAMIVMLHSQGYFGTIALLNRFTLTQGVCFFYVLSGFILTYAYPSLDRRQVGRFLVARFARVFPMHLVACALFVLTLPAWYREAVARDSWGASLLTVALLQAWVPIYRVQTALNGVSWSLSVELFFSLCFPFLLWHWRRTWRAKLALSFLLACGAVFVANYWLAHLPRGAEVRDVVYFYPLARLWEFTVGIATAHLWKYFHDRIRCGRRVGTALEIAVLAVSLLVLLFSGTWAHRAGQLPMVGPAGEAWLASSGLICLPFAALVGVMAFEWGWVARALSWRPLVLLGEISFSLYLLHLLVCHYYVMHPGAFVAVPPWLLYLGYWGVILVASYVGWAVIEVPCRRGIVTLWDRYILRRPKQRHAPYAKPLVPRSVMLSWPSVMVCVFLLMIGGLHLVVNRTPAVPPSLSGMARTDGRVKIALDAIGKQPAAADAPTIIVRHDYSSGAVEVVGWSVDALAQRPVRAVMLSVDGAAGTWTDYGSSRNDVSARLGSAALLHSGFVGMISLRPLTNGPHTLTIRALVPDSNAYSEMHASFVIT